MPTVSSLERLDALAKRLTPLAQVQRGTLIRAQDWNDLVGAVLDVARAVLAEDRITTVPPHKHTDEVRIDWLDPGLRKVVEGGPLADPGPQGRLGGVERSQSQALARVETLERTLADLRARLGDVATRHATRDAELADLHKVVAGLGDNSAGLEELRGSLRSIQGDVATALDLGRRLTVGGAPADLEALDRRLRGIEELRALMTLPSGQLLDAATIERRLTAIDQNAATKSELADLAARPATVAPGELAAIEGRLGTAIKVQVDQAGVAILAQASQATAAALGDIDAKVARNVADALPAFGDGLLATTRAETGAAVRAGSDGAVAAANARLTTTEAALRGSLDAGLADARAAIGAGVRAELDRQLPPRLAEVSAAQAGLTARVDTVAVRLDDADQRLAANDAQILAVSRNEAAARADLKKGLIAEMDRRDKTNAVALEDRLAIQSKEIGDNVNGKLIDARRAVLDEARQTATDAAVTEVKLAQTQIRAEVVALARDEVARANTRPAGPVLAGGTVIGR
jgi:hypothetical protein